MMFNQPLILIVRPIAVTLYKIPDEFARSATAVGEVNYDDFPEIQGEIEFSTGTLPRRFDSIIEFVAEMFVRLKGREPELLSFPEGYAELRYFEDMVEIYFSGVRPIILKFDELLFSLNLTLDMLDTLLYTPKGPMRKGVASYPGLKAFRPETY